MRPDQEQIARLVPKRNIETWILCLNELSVDEETDYKQTARDWKPLIRSGIELFFRWTRPNAQLPSNVAPSLQLGIAEMKKLDLREP